MSSIAKEGSLNLNVNLLKAPADIIDTYSFVVGCWGYSMKLDLLTNATVVDDAIRLLSSEQQRRLLSSSNNENDKETKEPRYNEESDKVGEEKQGETVETAPNIDTTMNQVF